MLDWIVKQGIPREHWALEWLKLAYGRIPDSISAEELAEVIPRELAEEIELLCMKAAGIVTRTAAS